MKAFEELWKEELDTYETIPDKSKITSEDKTYARGYYDAIDDLSGVIAFVLEELEPQSTLGKIHYEVAEDVTRLIKEGIEDNFDDLLTSIFDNYVE